MQHLFSLQHLSQLWFYILDFDVLCAWTLVLFEHNQFPTPCSRIVQYTRIQRDSFACGFISLWPETPWHDLEGQLINKGQVVCYLEQLGTQQLVEVLIVLVTSKISADLNLLCTRSLFTKVLAKRLAHEAVIL